jgi:hypothetical protein
VTDERNLTGVWHGLYTYPQQRSVSFVATLIETERWLSGSTHEPCVYGERPGATLLATVAGSRSGSAVTFVKTYDRNAGESFGIVNYEGTLSGDATEIEGRWSIPGVWSGKFLMIRSGGKAAKQTRAILERA